MKAEELEKAAEKWLDETDTMQFSQVELLTMFAESQLKEEKEENKRLRDGLKKLSKYRFIEPSDIHKILNQPKQR